MDVNQSSIQSFLKHTETKNSDKGCVDTWFPLHIECNQHWHSELSLHTLQAALSVLAVKSFDKNAFEVNIKVARPNAGIEPANLLSTV